MAGVDCTLILNLQRYTQGAIGNPFQNSSLVSLIGIGLFGSGKRNLEFQFLDRKRQIF